MSLLAGGALPHYPQGVRPLHPRRAAQPTPPPNRGAGKRTRRRDRHGRGIRGPLAPPQVPLARSRAQRFDDLVLDAVARLERRWAAELSSVEFAVEDVPPVDAWTRPGDPIPLAEYRAPAGDAPARIVVYRRPLEIRVNDDGELASLVHDVTVEGVADMLGLEPETVDPDYGFGY